MSALLLVMALLGAGLAAVLRVQTEPFSWEGPENQEERVVSSMRFDERGRLLAIAMAPGLAEIFDVLSKDMAYQVLDEAGREVFASPAGPALDALRRLPPDATTRAVEVAGGPIRLQVRVTHLDRHGARYLLRNARSERLALGIRSTGSSIFYAAAAGSAFLSILVFSTIALWMARRTVKPLEKASEAAAAIKPGNLTQRVDGRHLPSEIAPLVDAFNSALERLAEGYRVQQEFLAAAAHELKTPLSLMRAEIELSQLENRDVLLRDIDLMATHVQQLLQLAEVSEVQNFKFETLAIRHVLEQSVGYAARLAASHHVHLRLVVDAEPPVRPIDTSAIAILLRNLIQNAVVHSPVNGIVVVRLTERFVAVRDEGLGVAPDDVSKLFTRFWRSPNAPHQGVGLGLSICQKIAVAHGWNLDYRSAVPGPGAEFRISF